MVAQSATDPQRPILGVSVLARQGARVLLVRRARPPLADTWALPGGKVEPGERLSEAAAREVREETGMVVEPLRAIDFAEIIDRDNSGTVVSHYVVVVFEGEVLSGRLAAGDDAAEVKWASAADRRTMTLTKDTARVLSRLEDE